MITIHAAWLLLPMAAGFIWSIWPLSLPRYAAALSIFIAFAITLMWVKP